MSVKIPVAGELAVAIREMLAVMLPRVDWNNGSLLDTPTRYYRALYEMTEGYYDDPRVILSRTFAVEHDAMIVLSGIRFTSLCEHHLLPFVGTAAVGYVPGDRVVGISKLARLVTCYAKRLQVQERLTDQIADAIMEHLAPKGAGALVRAHHSCMGCRGAMQPDALMTTSALRGVMLDKPEAREEFLSLSR